MVPAITSSEQVTGESQSTRIKDAAREQKCACPRRRPCGVLPEGIGAGEVHIRRRSKGGGKQ